jgi:hypothetical protein
MLFEYIRFFLAATRHPAHKIPSKKELQTLRFSKAKLLFVKVLLAHEPAQ